MLRRSPRNLAYGKALCVEKLDPASGKFREQAEVGIPAMQNRHHSGGEAPQVLSVANSFQPLDARHDNPIVYGTATLMAARLLAAKQALAKLRCLRT